MLLMELFNMPPTNEQIQIECAKRDGYAIIERGGELSPHLVRDGGCFSLAGRNYTSSLDAILPLIKKWCNTDERLIAFENQLKAILARDLNIPVCDVIIMQCMFATPMQLCETLLRCDGGWSE